MDVHYIVSWYDKDTNILLGELEASPVPYADLDQLFTLSAHEAMPYESQLIGHQQAQVLTAWLPILFDFTQCIYQLDCFPTVKISTELPH